MSNMNNDIPTPRTDAELANVFQTGKHRWPQFARELERELAQAKQQIEKLESMATFKATLDAYKQIEHLERQLAQHEPPARSSED